MMRVLRSSNHQKYSQSVSSRDHTPVHQHLFTSFVPSSSHFRLVAVSTVANKFIDAVHRRMFLPQWKFCEQYEQLFRTRSLPFNTEDIAYTLPHLLAKVSSKADLQFTRAFTETGRELRSFADLPDFHSRLVLGTADDQPPGRSTQQREGLTRQLTMVTISLPKLRVHRTRVASRTHIPTQPLPFTLPVRGLSPPPKSYSHKVSPKSQLKTAQNYEEVVEEITLLGSTLRPKVHNRSKSKTQSTMTQDLTTDDSPAPVSPRSLAALFSAQQIEALQKEYIHLRHLSLVEKVNEAVKFSPRLPGNVRNYLSGVKSKVLDKRKDGEVFALYLRDSVPVLRGKPQNVFQAILKGLGSNGSILSWSQWLLLNSLLIHNIALESTKIHFVCRMLQSQNNYMDLLVLLTSVFQGEGRNQHFQVLFSQLKPLIGESMPPFTALQKMCEGGEIDYELIIDALKSTAPAQVV